MPRKVIVTAEDIWRARAGNWENHYQLRAQARSHSMDDAIRVLRACQRLPEPSLNMWGSLDDWNYNAARVVSLENREDIVRQAGVDLELLVKWYWSEDTWQNFVNQFNALPVPLPKYEMNWRDGYPQLVPHGYLVDISVDNPVYNSGTSDDLYTYLQG